MIAFASDLRSPQPVPCLFVGGPADGRVYSVRTVRQALSVPDFGDGPLRFDDPPRSVRAVTYWAFRLVVDPNDAEFVFYAAEGLTPVDVVRALWDAYASRGKVGQYA